MLAKIITIAVLITYGLPAYAQDCVPVDPKTTIEVICNGNVGRIRSFDPNNDKRVIFERDHERGLNIYRYPCFPKPNGQFSCMGVLGARGSKAFSDQEILWYQDLLRQERRDVITVDVVLGGAAILVALKAGGLILVGKAGALAAESTAVTTVTTAVGAAAASAATTLAPKVNNLGNVLERGLGEWTYISNTVKTIGTVSVFGFSYASGLFDKAKNWMDWTRLDRENDAVGAIWNTNGPRTEMEAIEQGRALDDFVKILNKGLIDLDKKKAEYAARSPMQRILKR